MAADAPSKKLRKPYTITKTRDRWTDEEHERFLDALLLFGRDWKKVEDFVGTKTVIQIRSHAQKYFLKVQKNGMMTHVPPPRPKRKAAYPYQQKASSNDKIYLEASTICPSESTCLVPASNAWGDTSMVTSYSSNETMLSADYLPAFPLVRGDSGLLYNSNMDRIGNSSKSWPDYEVPQRGNPHSLNSVIPNMAEIYRFIGDMFDPDIKLPLGTYLQKLMEMDPLTVRTILMMVRNLINNLSSPNFELQEKTLSTYRVNNRTMMGTAEAAASAEEINTMPSYCLSYHHQSRYDVMFA